MKLHANHRTCPSSRRLICRRVLEERWTLAQAADAAGCSERTAAKWLKRYREGDHALLDRSSRPRRSPRRLPDERVRAIEALRRLWMTAAEIAEILSLPLSTVSLWLRRIGLGKRSRLQPPEPPSRYERRHPGELVHVDIKRLSRISTRGAGHRVLGHRRSQYRPHRDGRKRGITGYEYVHVMIDDHSRLAYAEVLDDLRSGAAIGFLRRAVAWFAERDVSVQAVMTDNGSCFVAHGYGQALAELGLPSCGSGPAGHAPTARPSVSSRRSSTSGRTPVSTAARPSALPHYPRTSGDTTSPVPMAPLATRRRPRG